MRGKVVGKVAEQLRILERGGIENLKNIRNPIGLARIVAFMMMAFGIASLVKAGQRREPDLSEYAPVSYCKLIRDPEEYDGKLVAVRATYRYGFEWQEIFAAKCRDAGRTWLEFDKEGDTIRRRLAKLPHHQGTVNGTFYGRFRGMKGAYGDGGYRFRFDVNVVEYLEVVSKSGWAPETLKASEQRKFCQGDEEPSLSR